MYAVHIVCRQWTTQSVHRKGPFREITKNVSMVLTVLINIYAPHFLYIGQAFHYSPENAFYIFNQQIYFII